MNRHWLTIVTITKSDPIGLAHTLASTAHWRQFSGVEQRVVFSGVDTLAWSNDSVAWVRQSSVGIAGAFNEGLTSARGEWVWFLNGGDQIDSRLTPELLRALLAGTRADVVIGGITYEGEPEPRPHPPRELQWPPFRSWIPHPSTLVRRRLFERFGGFDERYSIAMDYEWWLRALGSSVAVDVLALPFAIFAPGGISQRSELRNQIRREKRHALWRHQAKLWRPALSANYLLARAWILALVSHRLRKSPRSS